MDYIDRAGGRFVTVMPRNRLEDAEFRQWIQTNTPDWTCVWDRPNPRHGDGPRACWYVYRARLPSAETWSVVWVWSLLLTLRQEVRRRRNIAAVIEELQQLLARLAGAKTRVLEAHKGHLMIEKRFEQVKTAHEIAPVSRKDEGRIEALFTVYFPALLVQALIERELRLVMKREHIDELRLYPEQRQCTRPTTEQILRMFSLAARHRLAEGAHTVQVFDVLLTDLQRQVLTLLGVSERTFRPPG